MHKALDKTSHVPLGRTLKYIYIYIYTYIYIYILGLNHVAAQPVTQILDHFRTIKETEIESHLDWFWRVFASTLSAFLPQI